VLSRLDGQHGRRVAAPSKKEKKTTGASERAEQSGPPLAPPAPLKSILKRPKEIQETTGTVGKRRTAQDRTASGRDGDGGGDDKDDSDVDDESAEDTSRPPKVSKRVSEALGRDDAEIAALEKKLGIKGKKKKRDKEAADGLDELLGALGGESSSDSETGRKRKRMDYEEWLSSKRQKAAHGGGETSEDDEPGSGPAFEPGSPESVTDDAEDLTGVDDNDDDDGENDDDNEDEEHSESDSAASDGVGESSPSPTKSKTVPAQRRARENPYLPPPVAPHSKDTLTTTNTTPYVPPARRRQGTQEEAAGDDNDDSARRRIRRQAQGLLNRLSESNLISLLSEVEQLYRAHPRQQVTSTLTDILVDLVGDQAALSDSFLILHAGFIAAMYKVIGMDLGAAVLHRVVERFDAKYAVASSNADNDAVGGGGGGGGGGDGDMGQTGREVFNLISLVAELYNIQAISSALVYDFIRLFLDKITEMNTELLLRIVKSEHPPLPLLFSPVELGVLNC
jgi:nucleolar MIF4G domain-containing protein 1